MISTADCKFLRSCPIFENIKPESFSMLSNCADVEKKTYSAGSLIYDYQYFEHSLGIIISGKVFIKKIDSGHETLMNILGSGGIFGAAAMFCGNEPDVNEKSGFSSGNSKYVTSVTAKQKTSIILIPQQIMQNLLESDNMAALNYIRFLSGRIRFLNTKIDSYTADSAYRKTANYLLSLFDVNDVTNPICINKKQLADKLNIGRASLYRSLALLEKKGAISLSENGISILDYSLLRDSNPKDEKIK